MASPVGTDVERAAAILVRGGLVAFATETVYGLGANACDPTAVARVFDVKQRPTFDPLIVHLADASQLDQVAASMPESARRLAARYWPGPLTLVLPKRQSVLDLVTAGLPTVAVRVPAHPLALALLKHAAVPIAAPSANLFGRVSPTAAEHVAEQLGDRIDYILDGGPCTVGLESTVVDLSTPVPRLLRPGGLALEEIESVIGTVEVVARSANDANPQASPGMFARHYATQTPLVVLATEMPVPRAARIGLLAFVPESTAGDFVAVEILSSCGDLVQAAARLFAAMRRLDALGLDLIVARPVPNVGLGRAINNRLERAAHGECHD